MKLNTAELILEWAEYGRTVSVTTATGSGYRTPDTATAKRLALGQKVLEIVERNAAVNPDFSNPDSFPSLAPVVCKNLLAEANGEK